MSSLDRKARLSALAKAPSNRLAALWAEWCDTHGAPGHAVLRKPEIGTVMVRGRAGAVGAPFNLGEITVTRTSVEIEGGIVGHGYVQGRDKEAALAAALVDALGQTDKADSVDRVLVQPLMNEAEQRANVRAEKAAATKVDFFTLKRGHA